MVNPSANPFVLPGFGQSGDLAQNPMMASLEMMRQAWQSMAGGALDHSLMAAPMSPEELERRIKDLRAIENWLRMNLSMLSSTIQGLEVQKATLSTLRSFVATASASGSSAADALSPLEVVLGIRKPGQAAPAAAPAPSAAPAASAWPESPSKAASAPETAAAPDAPAAEAAAGTPGDTALAGAAAAAQGWWDMLQKQFDTLAAATSATLQSAEAMKTAAMRTDATPDKPAANAAQTGSAAAKSATSARRSVAKKAVPRKTAARKTAAK